MKVSGKRMIVITIVWMFTTVLGVSGGTVAMAQTDNLYSFGLDQSAMEPEIPKNYSSLPGLVSMVCDDAAPENLSVFLSISTVWTWNTSSLQLSLASRREHLQT